MTNSTDRFLLKNFQAIRAFLHRPAKIKNNSLLPIQIRRF